MLAPGGEAELALRVRQLTQTRTEAWTPVRPRSAGSSETCTTARRPGWWHGHDPGRRRADHRLQPGRGPGAAHRGARRLGQGAGRAAGSGPRHPPAGAGRPRPGRRGPGAGAGPAAAGRGWPATCPAGRPRRSSRPPTSRSASCWPTSPSTPGPSQAWIDIRHTDGMLRIGVTDDGHGGAEPRPRHRAARHRAAAGGVRRSARGQQPARRPDPVTMEIPCALSSPKTSSC